MSEDLAERISLRRYLLGEISDEAELRRIEERLLGDDDFQAELAMEEEELIDRYVFGELSPDESVSFREHFLCHPQRAARLELAQRLKVYATEQRHSQPARPRAEITSSPRVVPWFKTIPVSLKIAAVVLLAIGLGLFIWKAAFRRSDVDRGLVALNAAYREQRPVEARISQMNYAPYVTTRGPGNEKIDQNQLRLAELTLLEASTKNPTPAVHHALGKVYLAKKQFDAAIKEFDEALKGDPRNAQLYNDLGAASLEKGKSDQEKVITGKNDSLGGQALREFGVALDNLNKALQFKSHLTDALFNRALCYEQMRMGQQADEAWRAYLSEDPSSAWADEAKRRLTNLQQTRQQSSRERTKVVDDFMAAFRQRKDEKAWDLLRDNYTSDGNRIANSLLSSSLRRDSNTDATALQALSYFGELARSRSGDSYYADLAHFYSSQGSNQRQALAGARQHLTQAYEYFLQSKTSEAIKLYTIARQEFARLGDTPEMIFTDYRIAHSYVIQPDIKKSREGYDRLSSVTDHRKYTWLYGQTLLGQAHVNFDLSQYSKAVSYSMRGLQVFQQSGYTDGLLRILKQLADEHEALNQKEQSLSFLSQALSVTNDHFCDPIQAWGIHTTLGFNFDDLGLYTVAAAYQTEALRIAVEMQQPLIISRSYAYLGETYGKLKDFDRSLANLKQAQETGKQLADEPDGVDMMANSLLQLGDVYRLIGNQSEALRSYDQCINLYKRLQFGYYDYAAHRGKQLTYLALRDDRSFQAELDTLLVSLERYRSNITEQRQRNSFFETQQSIYDAAIEFSTTRVNDPQTAFDYSELSRARTLFDLLTQGASVSPSDLDLDIKTATRPRKLTDIQSNLPKESQILQYSILDQKVVAWIISPDSFAMRQTDISATALTDRVNDFLATIAGGGDNEAEVRTRSVALYEILVRPVEALLNKERTLCIVPDKILNYLPFATLISRDSDRYLIEDFRIELAPSSTAFEYVSSKAAQKSTTAEERLLVVGNPSFDKSAFPDLPDLPSAGREAAQIARYYDSATLLTGSQARERIVKAQLSKNEVIHLALHYVADRKSEMLSKLILAKPPSNATDGKLDDGVLQASEIYQGPLTKTRLVVLSGCQTGLDRQYDGEGAIGIARPFVVAGVPVVIASLWSVDSESSADLMIAFHRHRRQDHVSSAEALRRAQVDFIRGSDARFQRPFFWGPFVAIGGQTTF